ncbi:HNH endonuclease [Streptomyces sp. 2114.2]|nr:HNH endonuclease [Streptomyces sp. 2221.1]SDT29098.1 HNH endonuclease [Streptomyces sp. 2114.2]
MDTRAEQLSLLGEPIPVRLPAGLWRAWLSDEDAVARFDAKRYVRSANQCTPWLGAVSSTGHGSFRAASLPGPSRRGTVPAHLFAYQLAHGVIDRTGWTGTEDPVVCHTCDFHGCTNPAHLRLGTAAENRAEWSLRRGNPHGPLADTRGAAGRTRAIAEAIRAGLRAGESTEEIEHYIQAAEEAGLPLTLW